MPNLYQPFYRVNHNNNMNVVRYCLSLCVLIAHTVELIGLDIPWIQRGKIAVGCFFALSGFLMFSSFQNKPTIKHYLSRRARKILPPYVFIVLLCAIGFVSISDYSITEYFANSGFWQYIVANLSFLNFLHIDLPGVFQGAEYVTPAVNGSLWTMKGEWVCYLSVPFIYWIISNKTKQYSALFLIGIIVICMITNIYLLHICEITEKSIYAIVAKQFGGLFVYFFIGALINMYYADFIKYKWYILIFDILVLFIGSRIPFYHSMLQPIVFGTLAIWVSMVGTWGAKYSRHDNISYELYLFHFPVIQLLISLGLPYKVSPVFMVLCVIVITSLLSYIAWNLIGKRFKAN